MAEEKSLQGWMPELDGYMTIERVVDIAFDYRGNTTIVKKGGTEIVAYVSNRNKDVPAPLIQYFDEQGNGPMKLLYSDIKNIKFSGKDMAAGNSYEAYLKRKAKQKEMGVHAPLNAAEDGE